MTLGVDHRKRAAELVEKIDKVSRQRELSETESRVLEWAIGLADGTHRNMRMPHGGAIAMARMGIKRDLTIYANKKTVGLKHRTDGTPSRERARTR